MLISPGPYWDTCFGLTLWQAPLGNGKKYTFTASPYALRRETLKQTIPACLPFNIKTHHNHMPTDLHNNHPFTLDANQNLCWHHRITSAAKPISLQTPFSLIIPSDCIQHEMKRASVYNNTSCLSYLHAEAVMSVSASKVTPLSFGHPQHNKHTGYIEIIYYLYKSSE
jgi:hypothetical protein